MTSTEIKVTKEEIQEALVILGIQKAQDPENMDDDPEEDDDETLTDEEKEKKKKKKEIEKALFDNASASELLQKELQSLENKDDSSLELGVLLKAQSEEISGLRKVNTELRTELGSMNTKFDAITKSFSDISTRVEQIGSQSAGRRSVIAGSYLEKAFQEEEGSGKKMLSLSSHKREIRGVLMDNSGIEKGQKDKFYADGLEFFEATGGLTDKIVVDLFKNKGIKIVP